MPRPRSVILLSACKALLEPSPCQRPDRSRLRRRRAVRGASVLRDQLARALSACDTPSLPRSCAASHARIPCRLASQPWPSVTTLVCAPVRLLHALPPSNLYGRPRSAERVCSRLERLRRALVSCVQTGASALLTPQFLVGRVRWRGREQLCSDRLIRCLRRDERFQHWRAGDGTTVSARPAGFAALGLEHGHRRS